MNELTLLLIAVLALMVGPLLAITASNIASLRAAIDGFGVVSVGGLALVLIAPDAIKHGGAIAFLLLIAGAVLPAFLHRASQRIVAGLGDALLVLSLALHAAIESAALATVTTESALALAIVAHRIPVGLAVFSLSHRERAGWIGVGVLVVATVVGYFTGGAAAGLLTETQDAWLHALVAGSLLHVLSGHRLARGAQHEPAPVAASHCCADDEAEPPLNTLGSEEQAPEVHEHAIKAQTAAATAGAVVGALLLLSALDHGHGVHASSSDAGFVDTFTSLALTSAPALLAGYLLAGFIGVVISQRRLRWLNGGGPLGQSLRGVGFGLPMPICSCGVLPLYQSLVKRGAPPAAGVAFLIATPELGLDAILLSIPLLGSDLTLARVAIAFAVALAAALLLHRIIPAPEAEVEDEQAAAARTLSQKLGDGLRFGLIDLFDHTMPWILAGLSIAALIAPLLSHNTFAVVPPMWQVPLFAILGIPAYVCASGATPIAAIAIFGGVSPGAAIAFLISGPATNVTTFGVLSQLHGRRAAVAFGLVLTVLAILGGWAVNRMPLELLQQMPGHHHHGPALVNVICLGVLVLLLLASLMRQGPRGMVRQVAAPFLSAG